MKDPNALLDGAPLAEAFFDRDPDPLGKFMRQAIVDRRRLEKAEWEDQLVTQTFSHPDVRFDFAKAASSVVLFRSQVMPSTPPHRHTEMQGLVDIVWRASHQVLSQMTSSKLADVAFPVTVQQSSAMGKSEAPSPPDDGRRLMARLDAMRNRE